MVELLANNKEYWYVATLLNWINFFKVKTTDTYGDEADARIVETISSALGRDKIGDFIIVENSRCYKDFHDAVKNGILKWTGRSKLVIKGIFS